MQATAVIWRTQDRTLRLESPTSSRNAGPLGGLSVSSHHQREVGMTRTDVVASSRPQAPSAVPMRRRSIRGCRALILPALSVAALAVPSAALAAEGTSGYSQTPSTP